MVITGDDKILLRKFRLSKKWWVEKFTRDFPNKKNGKSYKTGDVQRYPVVVDRVPCVYLIIYLQ